MCLVHKAGVETQQQAIVGGGTGEGRGTDGGGGVGGTHRTSGGTAAGSAGGRYSPDPPQSSGNGTPPSHTP